MQTNLGNLPITVDPVTGRAKMTRGGVDGDTRPDWRPLREGSHQSAQAGARRVASRAGSIPALASSFDSQLEADRDRYLYGLQLAGEIRKYVYHPESFPIGTDMIYTPDFMVWWANFSITMEEIKGSLKMKNARDSITRLKVAACLYPQFQWQLIIRVNEEWRIRRMK